MKSIVRAAFAAAFLLANPAMLHAAERAALVIGTGKYEKLPSLRMPAADARIVEYALKQLGFTVRSAIDGDSGDALLALDDFKDDAKDAKIAVVFIAGHGAELNGKNLYLSSDASPASSSELFSNSLEFGDIFAALGEVKGARVVLVDASYAPPQLEKMPLDAGDRRTVARGLAAMQADGVLVMSSAPAGETIPESEGDHGRLAEALLQHINTPSLDVSSVLDRVRQTIWDASGGKQNAVISGKTVEAQLATADVASTMPIDRYPITAFKEPRQYFARGQKAVLRETPAEEARGIETITGDKPITLLGQVSFPHQAEPSTDSNEIWYKAKRGDGSTAYVRGVDVLSKDGIEDRRRMQAALTLFEDLLKRMQGATGAMRAYAGFYSSQEECAFDAPPQPRKAKGLITRESAALDTRLQRIVWGSTQVAIYNDRHLMRVIYLSFPDRITTVSLGLPLDRKFKSQRFGNIIFFEGEGHEGGKIPDELKVIGVAEKGQILLNVRFETDNRIKFMLLTPCDKKGSQAAALRYIRSVIDTPE